MKRLVVCSVILAHFMVQPGCGGHGGAANHNQNQCPPEFRAEGPACVPIFDDCSGQAEIPVLGGGCQAVGVTRCGTGFVSDGEGGCEPTLPSETCPPGTMEKIGFTGCQPVGVTQCAPGFVSDGAGGCDAILPTAPCPYGTIELLGYDSCQPIGDCGTGTWGSIAVDATTVFVDASADATGADGSQQHPFLTVAEAYAEVPAGGQIAIATGEYEARLVIGKAVRLTGRCAERVTLRGQSFAGQDRPPITIGSGGSGTTIRGVTLTGPAEGLVVSSAQQVVIAEAQVLDARATGVYVHDGAEVTLQRVLVMGCAAMGISSEGSTVSAERSVVRETLPRAGTDYYGYGIQAACDSDSGVCGSLRVDSCLVAGNRMASIVVSGVAAEVTATVVLDTLPDGDGGFGVGIVAQCHSDSGVCGSLRVDSCLVAGSVWAGILTSGVDAEVKDTVVRDTSPDGDGTFGEGVSAQCYLESGSCGRLRVDSCLVAGSRGTGIFAAGVDTEITATAVRDSLPAGDGTGGLGIEARCYSGPGTCGRLRVDSCLVGGNRVVGIDSRGVDAEVTASVVRDTLPDRDGAFGVGIVAGCDLEAEACGSLRIDSCLVAGNRDMGIGVSGVEARVEATVVRDMQPAGDGTGGKGIVAQCDPEAEACGSLRVDACLIASSRDVGLFSAGVETEITATVVRDTQPEGDGTSGRGIDAECFPGTSPCGSLRVDACLIAGNREVGIFSAGVETEVTATVVRDTLPADNGTGGRGINAQCDSEISTCGSLHVSSSLLKANENAGVFIAGVPAILEAVVVRDTASNDAGIESGVYGQGIAAVCDVVTGECGSLSMTSCVVAASNAAGVALEGVSGLMASSQVETVLPQPLDEKYGYGVQVGGLTGQPLPTFHIRQCEIRDAMLAGVLFYRSQGTLSGSKVSGGQFSVAMNEGSSVTYTEDNEFMGTEQDDPQWVSLYPSPAPPPFTPAGSH